MQKRHWLVLLLLLLVAASGWWFWNNRQEKAKTLPPVKADSRVLAEGMIFPVKYAQLVMPVDGNIGEILVTEGEQVKVGQPLIRLIRQDYKARVAIVRSDLARASAIVEQAIVNLADTERELQRQQRLDEIGAIPRQQFDQAQTAAERNRTILAQAQAELQTQKQRLSETESLLDKTELTAPIEGTVMYLDVKPGEHASIGTVLVRIADESSWEIRSDDLTELVVAKVRIGDRVSLTFDGLPGVEIPGKVKFIRPYGEKKRGDITYTVTIAPERWDDRLRWNMTAQIAIEPMQ
ncbi:MAG: macA 7 [Firmicutes bacterium]|nr:macA 7 [Bacillota bacterium]